MFATVKKYINKVKTFVKEINKTFSNQQSFYSSKRIERMIIFVNANVMLDIMTYTLLNQGKIDYLGAVFIYASQMVYAGYQTKQIAEDIKKQKEILSNQP